MLMWQMEGRKVLLSGATNKIVQVLDRKDIAGIIDYSLLRPDATYADVERLCKEALQYSFYSVCIKPCFIQVRKGLLKESNGRLTTVIGYPLGMTLTEVKVYEAMNASLLGADELDIVINIGALKSGDWITVRKDISDVIAATEGKVHKTIIEACYLDDNEKKKAVKIALEAGSEFIKKTQRVCFPEGRKKKKKIIKKIIVI